MADQEQTTTQEATQQQEPKPATSPAGAENADKSPQQETVSYARFKEVNDKLKALEDEHKQADEAKQKLEEEQLKQQAKWEQLADQRKAKIDELAPRAEMATELEAWFLEEYEATIKDWPEEVRETAPDDDADVRVKRAWMKKHRSLAVRLMEDKTPPAGNGRRPPPVSPAGQTKAAEEQRSKWQRQAAARYR